MTTATDIAAPVQPISITLSLEELLVVLNTLEARNLLGIDTSTWLTLGDPEKDVALSVARRALTARGLAQIDDQGQYLIHRAVLTAVGVCAYAQRVAYIDHWPTPDVEPLRVFIYRRGTNSVVHVPAGSLQHFHLLESEVDLASFLAATYGWTGTPHEVGAELRMSRDEFSRACEASAGGDRAAATQILAASSAADGVSAFVDALSGGPSVSILQTIGASDDARADSEDTFTVVQSGGDGWLIAPVAPGPSTPLRATPSSPDRLRGRLRDVLWAGS